MPEILPSASKTVHGIIAPDACSPSRRSISLRMSSARGTEVYQSFHSSPSFTASVSPSHWACDKGSSRAYRPLSDTGSSQVIEHSIFVIPGWSEGPDPESRDSGFDASHRPGMTDRLLRTQRGA